MFEYYGALCTKMYESGKSKAAGIELNFYLSYANKQNIKVLEPMCGNGRMLIPFMQEGIDIEGFDISEEMLKVCVEKAKQFKLTPKVYFERIEEFTSKQRFDLIMIPYGSFSLLPDGLVPKSLQNLQSVLSENGKLLLTIVTKNGQPQQMTDWQETNRKEFADETIVEYKRSSFDQESHILHTELKYESFTNGKLQKTELMDFPIRLYDLQEFKATLLSNGFSQVTVHEVKDGYGEGSSFHVFECTSSI